MDALNLLGKCLVYDPKKRISAKDVRTTSNVLTRFADYRLFPGFVPRLLLRFSLPDSSVETTEAREEGHCATPG